MFFALNTLFELLFRSPSDHGVGFSYAGCNLGCCVIWINMTGSDTSVLHWQNLLSIQIITCISVKNEYCFLLCFMLFAKFIWMLSSLRARMRLSKSIMHLQPRVSHEHHGSFVMTCTMLIWKQLSFVTIEEFAGDQYYIWGYIKVRQILTHKVRLINPII